MPNLMGVLGRFDGAGFGDEGATVQAIRMDARLCVGIVKPVAGHLYKKRTGSYFSLITTQYTLLQNENKMRTKVLH